MILLLLLYSLPLLLSPQISCTHPTCSSVGILSELLIRTDNENERDKWVATLDELQKAAKQLATKKVTP